MRKLTFLLTLFFCSVVFSQDEKSIQKEIDATLWKPFKAAFETLNVEELNALYADEVLRVTPGGIDTEGAFKLANVERFNKNIASKTQIKLDFWFDSRHTNMETSYEVGFYRMKLSSPKETNTIYGQFHIVLKKSGGKWLIIQDWDTEKINGASITASDFEKQTPLQFE